MPYTKILTVINTSHEVGDAKAFVIEGTNGNPSIKLNKLSSTSIDFYTAQLDEKFADSLFLYKQQGFIRVLLGGVELSESEIGALKYSGAISAAPTDELVKVGSSGTPDYLSSTYFSRSVGTNIIPVQRINDSGTGLTQLWSASKISSHTTDSTIHRQINDSAISTTSLWSSNKINTELGTKADADHVHFTNPRIVFKEEFIGDGFSKTFTLTGSILNGTFTSGSWSVANVKNTFPSDITGLDNKPTYDSTNIFTRNRITTTTISGAGLVTLDFAPRSGVHFYIWYWYELQDGDVVDDYIREDFVADMEDTTPSIAAEVPVDSSGFSNILSVADSDVQLALGTLDTHYHPYQQVVTVAKSGGMFDTITAALNSITDAAANKKYVIFVYPGVYSESITLKDYVDIVGIGPPRSVVLTSSSATVVTASNSNRSDVRNLTMTRNSSINGDSCVLVTAGTHLFYDCVIEQFSSNAAGCAVNLSGTGVFQFNTGQITLVQTGTSVGVNHNCLIDTAGSTELYLRGINGNLFLSDHDDNAYGFNVESTASGSISWQDCYINVNVTVGSYTGSAAAHRVVSSAIDRYIMSSRIIVQNTSGSVSGSGYAYIIDSSAGGAYIKSSHNIIDVTGFANNYYANVDTGDSLISEFDSIEAAEGSVGLGDVDNDDGVRLYHGVFSRSTVPGSNCLPTHITSTTFTLGATANPIKYFYRGIECTVSSNKTATLDDGAGGSTAGIYWVYFYKASGTILATKAFPGFSNTSNILIASVIWNGSNYGLVNDERHSYSRNQSWHTWAHSTVGARYKSGFDFVPTGTGATATFTMSSGELWDEDITFSAPASSAYPTPHTLRTFYQTSATSYVFDTTTSTIPFKAGPNFRPMYVNSTGYVLTEALVAPTKYLNFFIYGTTDLHTPIYCFAETVTPAIAASNGYGTPTEARAIPFPNLSGFSLSPELKPLYRLVVRTNGEVQALIGADDYRSVSSLPMSGGITSTTASSVSFTPAGDISSSNVQLALEELDSEKEKNLTFSTGLTRSVNTITSDISTGVAGGQTIYGGVNSGDDLTISSTTHATKGNLFFGNSTYDEVLNVLAIGTTDLDGTPPIGKLVVKGTTNDGSTNILVGRDSDEANVFLVDTQGNTGINCSTFGTNAAGVLAIGNGTPPSSAPANTIQIYAKDSSDGASNSTLAIQTEQSVEAIGTFTPSHKLKVWINGVEYWLQLDAV